MGVLACDRRGCDNIMSDNYSHEYGYLCNSCLSDLVEAGPVNIEEWMGIPAGEREGSDYWESFVRDKFETRY